MFGGLVLVFDVVVAPCVCSVVLGDVIKVEIDVQLLEPDTTG
jgi:hypothetical protein